ncbi:Retrovirus-related Pol polyprotein from transposon TNT 1-94 [Eumeta japonica]|uniref:Retrovirus-related Pol polyprotein from transposon TNT 1-94 n=1 Tax=Eumeta variegata TaxID=151549 RepID=A0A4C1Z9B4_EUMVA|nr:Retrovirus-related Pol polyprotein from transposon TNT 1-94 [Eumeta japonica]
MYKLNTVTGNAYAVISESKPDLTTWHKKMGPLNMTDVKRLELYAEDFGSRAYVLLEIIHTDLCGPMKTPSAGGGKYFITFIDDYSRKVYVYFLKNNMNIKSVFEKFKVEVENELGKKIKILRSDNGKEFCNKELYNVLAASGIKHQTSTPYTLEQNGLAERMNRTLVERAKCMLFEAKLQKSFWAEAVATAAYVINRSPSRVLAEVTPYEKWTGKKLNISYLKIFGSKAMVHVPKQNRLKWDRKSRALVFVGYCENTKGYRFFDPICRKVVISRDVTFIEKCDEIENITKKISTSVQKHATIPISTENDRCDPQNLSVENEDTINVDDSSPNTQDITSSSSNYTSFDTCVMNRRTDDETYYPDTDDYYDDDDDIQRNITLRLHQKQNMQSNNFMCVMQVTDPLLQKHYQVQMLNNEGNGWSTNLYWTTHGLLHCQTINIPYMIMYHFQDEDRRKWRQ